MNKIRSVELTPEELYIRQIIYSISSKLSDIYCKHIIDKQKDTFSYKIKDKGKNKGQFGYYNNQQVFDLYILLKRLNIDSICDLGSGAGILLYLLRLLNPKLKAIGYEIEDKLIEYSKENFHYNVEKKDILKLTKKDIEQYKVLYFWEPLKEEKLCESFVKNLEKILSKDQIIIYRPSGRIYDFLEKSTKIVRHFKEDSHNIFADYYIYKLKN